MTKCKTNPYKNSIKKLSQWWNITITRRLDGCLKAEFWNVLLSPSGNRLCWWHRYTDCPPPFSPRPPNSIGVAHQLMSGGLVSVHGVSWRVWFNNDHRPKPPNHNTKVNHSTMSHFTWGWCIEMQRSTRRAQVKGGVVVRPQLVAAALLHTPWQRIHHFTFIFRLGWEMLQTFFFLNVKTEHFYESPHIQRSGMWVLFSSSAASERWVFCSRSNKHGRHYSFASVYANTLV